MCRSHLELYTQWAIDAGTEFTISYGSDKSNFELMRDYGFCLPDNPADMVNIVEDLQRTLSSASGAHSS